MTAINKTVDYRNWRDASIRTAEPASPNKKMVYETVWETYVELGDNAYRNGHCEIAVMMLKAALKEARQETVSNDLCGLLSDLASLYKEQQRYKKAEVLYKRALETSESLYGKNDIRLCEAINNLAGVFALDLNYAQAERLYSRSLMIAKREYGANDKRITPSLLNLIRLFASTGRFDKAEPYTIKLRELEKQSQPRLA